MRNMVRGCDRVYHLAADPNLWRRNRAEFDEINHIGTLNVIRAALDSGVSRALYVSTESILTSDESCGGAVESVRFREKDMIGPYCLSKFRAEQAVFQLAEAGAPVVVCSPTLPVGPGDRNQTPPTRLSVAFCQGKIPAYLDCRLNLIDVRDVADGLVRAMQRGRPGVRYLLGGHNYRLIRVASSSWTYRESLGPTMDHSLFGSASDWLVQRVVGRPHFTSHAYGNCHRGAAYKTFHALRSFRNLCRTWFEVAAHRGISKGCRGLVSPAELDLTRRTLV